MVIRRIRQHIETHNWFAVTIDLAIVIVGVFLGAQANNWNERRIEQAQSVSYRNRLIDELDFNARQFAGQIAYYEQVKEHALATMGALRTPSRLSGRDFLIVAYQSTQIDITPAKRFIYDEMVASGLVDRLGSERLQAEASDYYLGNEGIERTYGEVPPYRALMRTLIPHDVQAQIRGQCGDRNVMHQGRVIASALPHRCEVSFPPEAVAAGMARIQRESRLDDELNRYLSWLNEKIGGLAQQHDQTYTLRRALISAL